MSIEIRETDDWISIRIDGKLVHGNHSVNPLALLDMVGVKYEREYRDDCDQDWLDWEQS